MKTPRFRKALRGILFCFLFFFIGLLSKKGLAETPVKMWDAHYNGPANRTDYPSKVATDRNGNVFVTGYSCRNSAGLFSTLCSRNADSDYATIKYDPDGTQLWEARYDYGGDDTAIALFVDQAGNVFVTGTSVNPTMGTDFATVKYDSTGRLLWAARYNGGVFDSANALFVDSSDNVYVTGQSSNSGGNLDFATVKYNASGQQQWAARYHYAGNDVPFALSVDAFGNVHVTGYSCHEVRCTSTDYATLKYDADGNQLWAVRYGTGGYNGAQAIALDPIGNIYVTGESSNGVDSDYATIKYDSAGNPLWIVRYDYGGNDQAAAISVDTFGSVIVTGSSYNKAFDYATVKYDSSGKELWAARYDSGGCQTTYADDYARTLFLDASGDIYVIGYQTGIDIAYHVMKYDTNGKAKWLAKYTRQSHDYGVDLSIDPSGGLYVIGGGWNGSNYDYTTVKYLFTTDSFSFDNALPTTHYVRSDASDETGWDNHDVDISLWGEDACNTSGIREVHYQVNNAPEEVVQGPSANIHLTEEGVTTLRYHSVDQGGNAEESHTVFVKIDKTPPTVVSSQAPMPNAAGWNSTDVIVQFSPSDALSGEVHCTATSVDVTYEGADQIVDTACSDAAGNTAHAGRKVSIDKTAPRLAFENGLPPANNMGWNRTDVSIPFETWDDLSGVATISQTAPLTLSSEGRGVAENIIVTDLAGNSATYRSPSYNIDKSPPLITVSQSTMPNSAGWNNNNVTVYFSATDILSGEVHCTIESVEMKAEGENLPAETTCTDLAGNSALASKKVNIDKTAPLLILPDLEPSYPLNSSLTLLFGANDGLSGIGSTSAHLNGVTVTNNASVILNQQGTHTFSLTAVDRAGNTVTKSLTFNVQVPYQFSGFLPPLTAGSRTVFHLGSVIPVKFKLTDPSGAPVPDITARLSLRKLSGTAPVGDTVDPTSVSAADSGDLFRYEGGHYIYNLDTRSLSQGVWELQAILEDGSIHSIQIGLKSESHSDDSKGRKD